jgi:hypothetical protein
MRFFSVLLILTVGLGGCYTPSVPFDAKAAAFINEKGDSRLDVHAFFRTGRGRVVFAAGEYVFLVPATPYSEQRIELIYRGRKIANVVKLLFDDPNPEYMKYVRSAKAESNGRVSFEGVAPGDYFVVSSVTVDLPGMLFPEGGVIYERVTVTGKEKEPIKVIVSGK